MSWEKNFKKKHVIANSFYFLVNFIRPTGPMVTRYTGGLSQLLLVKISRGKKLKEKPIIENNFCFLVKFIKPTCQLHIPSRTPPHGFSKKFKFGLWLLFL